MTRSRDTERNGIGDIAIPCRFQSIKRIGPPGRFDRRNEGIALPCRFQASLFRRLKCDGQFGNLAQRYAVILQCSLESAFEQDRIVSACTMFEAIGNPCFSGLRIRNVALLDRPFEPM